MEHISLCVGKDRKRPPLIGREEEKDASDWLRANALENVFVREAGACLGIMGDLGKAPILYPNILFVMLGGFQGVYS